MSLHLVIGFDGPSQDAKPSIVYIGRDGNAARDAIAATTVFRYEAFRNPAGVRKTNPNYRPPAPAPVVAAAKPEVKPLQAKPRARE